MQFSEGPKAKSVRNSLVNSPNRPLKLIEYISQHASSSDAASLNQSFKGQLRSRRVGSFTNNDNMPSEGDENEVDLR